MAGVININLAQIREFNLKVYNLNRYIPTPSTPPPPPKSVRYFEDRLRIEHALFVCFYFHLAKYEEDKSCVAIRYISNYIQKNLDNSFQGTNNDVSQIMEDFFLSHVLT